MIEADSSDGNQTLTPREMFMTGVALSIKSTYSFHAKRDLITSTSLWLQTTLFIYFSKSLLTCIQFSLYDQLNEIYGVFNFLKRGASVFLLGELGEEKVSRAGMITK